jgi:cyclic pyranopterin phosphate synthase
MEENFTHFNEEGRAKMVDVTDKDDTHRVASAQGTICMKPDTLRLINEGQIKKGDVLAVAQVAGVMGAKKTSDVIPMCHPLAITSVDINFQKNDVPDEKTGLVSITVFATAKVTGKTGIEMESLTAVSMTLLTIYDMCKAVDREMTFQNIGLSHKSGGKSGTFNRKLSAGV